MMLVVVTPVKNESENLVNLSQIILRQTQRPNFWLIIDDGSTDDTPHIIANLEKKYGFVKGFSLQTKDVNYDPIFRYGAVVRQGVEHALDMYSDLEFLGILDADIRLKMDYYEKILNSFRSNAQLGIASGLYIVSNGKAPNHLRILNDTICGGAMVFRKKCLMEIDGFPACPSPDTAAIIKAVNRGWLLGVVTSVYAFHPRVNMSRRKFVKLGLSRHVLGLHPASALLNGFLQPLKTFSPNPLGFTVGYFAGALMQLPKIKDEEISEYFRRRFYLSVYKHIKRIITLRKIEMDPIRCATIKL